MRHKKKGRRLGRSSSHRKALAQNILKSLFKHGQIVTTLHKAKEYAPMADKLITLAKKAEKKVALMVEKAKEGQEVTAELEKEISKQAEGIRLAYYRRAITKLQDRELVQKIFYSIAPLLKDRAGGYTSILHLNKHRLGDNAKQAILKLVVEMPSEEDVVKTKEEKKAEKKKLKQYKEEIKRKKKERKEKQKEKERLRKEKEKERLRKAREKKKQK